MYSGVSERPSFALPVRVTDPAGNRRPSTRRMRPVEQRNLLIAITAAALLLGVLPSSTAAHPEGFSGLRLYVHADRAAAVLTVHTRDMSQWFPPGKYPNYVADVSAALAASAPDLLEVRADGAIAAPSGVRTSSPEVGLIQVEIDYPISPGRLKTLEVWSKH